MNNPASAERDLLLRDYLHLASITFLYYDHLVTFIPEIRYVWTHKWSYGSVTFLLNRYLAFGGNIAVTIYSFRNVSPRSCKHEALFRQGLLMVNTILSGGMLIALATVLAAVSCWAILGGTTSAASKESGCHIDTSLDAGIHQATAWEALFIYDVFVFVLTVLRTWRAPSMHLRSLTGRVSLVRVLLRDGAIYFTVMAAANLANILTFYLADDALRGVLSTFASSISVVMASRLMLNLYQAAEPPESNSRDISWAPPSTGTMSISIRLVSPRTPRLGPRLESQRGIEDVELRDIGEVRRDPECAVDRR